MYNNVYVLTEASLVGDTRLFYGDQQDMEIINCIFYMRGGCDITNSATGISHSYNYYNLGTGSTIGWTAGGTEITNNTTPLWEDMVSSNPTLWDYHPADSTTLSAGTDLSLTPDYYGQNVSTPFYMGVSQYESVTPPAPTNKIRGLYRVKN